MADQIKNDIASLIQTPQKPASEISREKEFSITLEDLKTPDGTNIWKNTNEQDKNIASSNNEDFSITLEDLKTPDGTNIWENTNEQDKNIASSNNEDFSITLEDLKTPDGTNIWENTNEQDAIKESSYRYFENINDGTDEKNETASNISSNNIIELEPSLSSIILETGNNLIDSYSQSDLGPIDYINTVINEPNSTERSTFIEAIKPIKDEVTIALEPAIESVKQIYTSIDDFLTFGDKDVIIDHSTYNIKNSLAVDEYSNIHDKDDYDINNFNAKGTKYIEDENFSFYFPYEDSFFIPPQEQTTNDDWFDIPEFSFDNAEIGSGYDFDLFASLDVKEDKNELSQNNLLFTW